MPYPHSASDKLALSQRRVASRVTKAEWRNCLKHWKWHRYTVKGVNSSSICARLRQTIEDWRELCSDLKAGGLIHQNIPLVQPIKTRAKRGENPQHNEMITEENAIRSECLPCVGFFITTEQKSISVVCAFGRTGSRAAKPNILKQLPSNTFCSSDLISVMSF